MARDLQSLAEQRISAAVARGELTGLRGEGAPLPDHPGDALVDTGNAVAYRLMAEAGSLPEELRLKAQVQVARQAVRARLRQSENPPWPGWQTWRCAMPSPERRVRNSCAS